MEYPDTPWGHAKRAKAERAGVPLDDVAEPTEPESETEVVTKKKKKVSKKK